MSNSLMTVITMPGWHAFVNQPGLVGIRLSQDADQSETKSTNFSNWVTETVFEGIWVFHVIVPSPNWRIYRERSVDAGNGSRIGVASGSM